MRTDEGFDCRGRVDVGDRDDTLLAVLDAIGADTHLLEFPPGHLELVGRRHVGHRAAGREVGQDDFLMRRAQDVGALGHEVDAAKDDELCFVLGRRGVRELQRVADEVGELDDLVALVVMAEDDDARAERLLGCGNPRVHLVV